MSRSFEIFLPRGFLQLFDSRIFAVSCRFYRDFGEHHNCLFPLKSNVTFWCFCVTVFL